MLELLSTWVVLRSRIMDKDEAIDKREGVATFSRPMDVLCLRIRTEERYRVA